MTKLLVSDLDSRAGGSLKRVFIANRGEIALRIIAACRDEGVETVLGVSEADVNSRAAAYADRVVCIGPGPAGLSYLNEAAVIAAALGAGCDAVHPGYGFLSERASFSQACADAGLIFIGPSAQTIEQMGDKIEARAIAESAGVPVVPGTSAINSVDEAVQWAANVGYPVVLKAPAGGGGRGIKIAASDAELRKLYSLASAEVGAAFGDSRLYLERYVARARHLEVQVLADNHGNVVHVGCRDCSLQRRFQKLVEEAPPFLPHLPRTTAGDLLDRMCRHSVNLAAAVNYRGAGTVEFILDQDTGEIYFLEMNTRIQVEHPVTEELFNIDLVAEQLRIAANAPLKLQQQDLVPSGHVIECRITAESPERGFVPSPGTITMWNIPSGRGIRVDTHCDVGVEIPAFYDSLLAKVIVSAPDRPRALRRMARVLSDVYIAGVDTNVEFLSTLMQDSSVLEGAHDIGYLERSMAS